MRFLGVDYGTRNIGVAAADAAGIGARPLTTLRDLGARAAVERLAALAREHEAGAVVVGVPTRADGSEGDAARAVLRFVERLRAAVEVPVHTFPERLTSVAAEERLREMNVRGDERKRRVDEVAAAIILDEYLGANAPAGEALDG